MLTREFLFKCAFNHTDAVGIIAKSFESVLVRTVNSVIDQRPYSLSQFEEHN